MESSRHLLFYRLDSSFSVPAIYYMPHVEQISLIQCSPTSISQLLHKKYFPSLQRIHYLSGPPSNKEIHQRFSKKMDWIFPMADYPFYNTMVEAGYGRKDEWIVRNHLVCEKMIDGARWFDLYLPSRSIVYGDWYYEQQTAYFNKKHCDGFQVSYPIKKEYNNDIHRIPEEMKTTIMYDSRWIYQQECIERDFITMINHPDATLCHNSSK
jgi:hypothetical protein